jgi:hypothetical protein
MVWRVTPVLAPQPTADDIHYWEGIAAGQLLLQRPMCGNCQSLRWETFPSTLQATVVSWIIPRHPPVAPGDEQLIALVETDEGARLVVNLHDFAPKAPVNEARVEIFMLDVGDGVVLPQARPLATDAGSAGQR